MKLNKKGSVLLLGGRKIGCLDGFYSLDDMLDALGEANGVKRRANLLYTLPRFRSLCRSMFGLEIKSASGSVKILKSNGLYFHRNCAKYCDLRLWLIFYALTGDDALADCLDFMSRKI